MSDPQDIVARLRAYTQHDRPVLSSDLKNAADYVEQLRRELIAANAHRDIHRDDLAAARRRADRAAEENAHLNNTLELFVQGIQSAAGIGDLRCERDAARTNCKTSLESLVAAEDHRQETPIPTTVERFDEIERRMAELESRVRKTERRLANVATTMSDAYDHNPTAKSIAARLNDALTMTLVD